MIISLYIQISNHVVHLKLILSCISVIPQFKKKESMALHTIQRSLRPPLQFQQAIWLPTEAVGLGSPRTFKARFSPGRALGKWPPPDRVLGAWPLPCTATGEELLPQWFQKAKHQTKQDYSETYNLMEFTMLVFDLLVTHHRFLLSYFSLLEWGCLYYALPTIVFWKHRACLVSQLYSWRGIFASDKSYLD